MDINSIQLNLSEINTNLIQFGMQNIPRIQPALFQEEVRTEMNNAQFLHLLV